MAYDKDQALDTHKDFKENISNWEYFIRSYNGGYDYKVGQYLNRYNLELDNEFNQRLANTPCDNHCRNVIQIYSSFLFRVKPSRDFGSLAEEQSLDNFMRDADLEGNNFNSVIKQAQNKLAQLEAQQTDVIQTKLPLFVDTKLNSSLSDNQHEVLAKLDKIDLDALSPRDAWDLLAEWKDKHVE